MTEAIRGQAMRVSFISCANILSAALDEQLSHLSLDAGGQGDGDIWEPTIPFDPAQCLFCRNTSSDLDENLRHMYMKHGFTIPDEDRFDCGPGAFSGLSPSRYLRLLRMPLLRLGAKQC